MSTLKRHNLVRWYSDDGPLVGTITAVEKSRLHVRFDDGRELQFAPDGGALDHLRLAAGSSAVLPGTGERVTIGEAREIKGVLFYEVTLPSGTPQHVLEDALRPAVLTEPLDRMRAGELDRARSVNLRLAGTRLRFAFEQDELASLQASRVEIKAHQVGVVHRVSRSYPHRFILADEVGLGKTIEAALIIRELKARGVANRVLVLAPSGLVTQWQSELKHKFNQVFADFRGPLVKVLEGQNPGENVWTLNENVVSSTTFAAYDDDRIGEVARAGWDLVVVDEAHHARRTRRADKQESTRLYRLLERLVDPEHGQASSMLLLTATPMQLDPFEIYSLIELLDPTLFASPDDFEHHRGALRGLNATVEALRNWSSLDEAEREDTLDAASTFLERSVDELAAELETPAVRAERIEELNGRHRLSQVMIRNRKKVVGGFMPRVAAIWEVDLTPAERAAYDALTAYARDGFARSQDERRMALGFVMVMFQKLATSSSRALRNSLLKRMEKLEQTMPAPAPAALAAVPSESTNNDDEFSDAVEEVGEEAIAEFAGDDEGAEATWREVQDLERIVRLLEQIPIDTKTRVLLERLKEIRSHEPEVRVLLFTQFRGTQEEIKERIPAPWTVHLFHGDLDPGEKDAEVGRFRDSPGPQILVSTEAGGEGRNLQFSHWVINYDLPWNPMKVEQRIGRVDRIGQKDTVMVGSFSTRGTVEERVVEVLSRRIGVFEETIGGLDPILGSVESDLRRLFLYADQESEKARNRLSSGLEDRIRDARQAEERLADLIMDNRSLRRDEVDRLLARTQSTTHEDLQRFLLAALAEMGCKAEPNARVPETFDLELKGDATAAFPQIVREGPRRHVTFDRSVAQDHEDVEFLAFGHELVDGVIERVCGEKYRGTTSVRVVQTDELAPCRGWFFVYAIEVDGVIRRRELFPVFIRDDGRDDPEDASTLLALAARVRREEGFGASEPLTLPPRDAAFEAVATEAEDRAFARMVAVKDELEPLNADRNARERDKLERFYEYKRVAAARKLADTRRVVERVSTSDDPAVMRIIPVWARNLERATKDAEAIEGDRKRRFKELDGRATMATRTSRLTVSFVEVEPDPSATINAVRAAVSEPVFRRFRLHCGRPEVEDLVRLRAAIAQRRDKLRALASKHQFDSHRADECAVKLDEMLSDPASLTSAQRVIVAAGGGYFLDPNDEVADVRAPDGFIDDLDVVHAVSAALTGPHDPAASPPPTSVLRPGA
jgi:SNF2 family DNA or RNA helicase/uncharacterized membrane protein YkvA (DUF1232 family)